VKNVGNQTVDVEVRRNTIEVNGYLVTNIFHNICFLVQQNKETPTDRFGTTCNDKITFLGGLSL